MPTLTSDDLRQGLLALGLRQGMNVLVHCGLRRVGNLAEGAQTLQDAVLSVIGPAGTVVVPTGTANNSTTSSVFRAATAGMNEAERAAYEAGIAGFDRQLTPSYRMGAFAEKVRTTPGALRSGHPQSSFAALGPKAADLTRVHRLEQHLGEESPLGALYEADAVTLLIGVGYESCSALHLAEYRRARPPAPAWHRCFVMVEGRRVQRDFLAPRLDDSSFVELGRDLDSTGCVAFGMVGNASCRLLPMREAVDFGVKWMNERY